MTTDDMIRELRNEAERHQNDSLCTGELNITAMCTDVANRLEELNDKSCKGCKHQGQWENELELGYNCPCIRCSRRCQDNYEKEHWWTKEV